jgi:TPR repeat protein
MSDDEIWATEPDQAKVHEAHSFIKTDPARARSEFRALAERGSVASMIYLGWMFHTGAGMPSDLREAENWYRRAFDCGSDKVIVYLGRVYRRQREYTKAKQVFRVGVERGIRGAMYGLAITYLNDGEPHDATEVRALLERAAALGHPYAMGSLPRLLLRGKFGLLNIPKAIPAYFRLLGHVFTLARRTAPPYDFSKTDYWI